MEIPGKPGQKEASDSGGEENPNALGPYGDVARWGVRDMLRVSYRIMADSPLVWMPLVVFSGLFGAFPLVGMAAWPISMMITASATEHAIRGEPSSTFLEAWGRSSHHLWNVFTSQIAHTGVTILFSIAGALAILTFTFALGDAGLLALVAVVPFLLYRYIRYTLYVTQAAVFEQKGWVAAVQASDARIGQNHWDLLGPRSLALFVGFAALNVLGNALVALLVSLLLSGLSPVLASWAQTFSMGLVLAMPMVLGQICWSLLYLRGVRRLGLQLPGTSPSLPPGSEVV